MPHLLSNSRIALRLDLPLEHYQAARFDWTGKISGLSYEGYDLAGAESLDPATSDILGRGFYNEFGIDTALGFEEAKQGEWFHKIGIGLLRKDQQAYRFNWAYEIRPAIFEISTEEQQATIICRSADALGYAYVLQKQIALLEDGFLIAYELQNTGQKEIVTEEYVHNFVAFDRSMVGPPYVLHLPFQTQPEAFIETVNPEGKVQVSQREIRFLDTPSEPFFFSNLSGDQAGATSWELRHQALRIGLREVVDFSCSKANLWGCGHVVSPELFCSVDVQPGQTAKWRRQYTLFRF